MKMKRSELKVSNDDRLTEVSRELTMRWAVYTKQIQEKKLSQFEANKRYFIIAEYKDVLKELQRIGMDLTDLIKALKDTPGKDQVRQVKIDFTTTTEAQ